MSDLAQPSAPSPEHVQQPARLKPLPKRKPPSGRKRRVAEETDATLEEAARRLELQDSEGQASLTSRTKRGLSYRDLAAHKDIKLKTEGLSSESPRVDGSSNVDGSNTEIAASEVAGSEPGQPSSVNPRNFPSGKDTSPRNYGEAPVVESHITDIPANGQSSAARRSSVTFATGSSGRAAVAEDNFEAARTGSAFSNYSIARGASQQPSDDEKLQEETAFQQPERTQVSRLVNALQDKAPALPGNAGASAFSFGQLQFSNQSRKTPAQFAKVPGWLDPSHDDPQMNVHLLRFIAERVWKLKRPQLLISVTGGAADFNLTTVQKDKLLQGLMSVAAKHLDCWFITGGSDAGIMKYVGEARAKYAVNIPLIGVAAWGVVQGRHYFDSDEFTNNSGDSREDHVVFYDRAAQKHKEKVEMSIDTCTRCDNRKGCKLCHEDFALLNENHSHFFLVDTKTKDGKQGTFGAEVKTRTWFEKCVAGAENHNQYIVNEIEKDAKGQRSLFDGEEEERSQSKADNIKWLAGFRSPSMVSLNASKRSFNSSKRELNGEQADTNSLKVGKILLDRPKNKAEAIPSVCVCVQGGPGSVKTVLETVKSEVPAFLVKGSGKAADLIADMVLLKFSHGHKLFLRTSSLSSNQKKMLHFFEKYGPLDKDRGRRSSSSYETAPASAKQTPRTTNIGKSPDTPQPKQDNRDNDNEKQEEYRFDFQKLHNDLSELETTAKAVSQGNKKKPLFVNNFFQFKPSSFPSEQMLTSLNSLYTAYYGEDKQEPNSVDLEKINIINSALSAAITDYCWVYDLDNSEPGALDLSGSLLRCIIHSMGTSPRQDGKRERTHKDEAEILYNKVLMAIKFDREDVLQRTILKSKFSEGQDLFKSALNRAMEYALLHNKVKHVSFLLEHGASLDHYQFPQSEESPSEEVLKRLNQRWKNLLSAYKTDVSLQHVMRLMAKTKKITRQQLQHRTGRMLEKGAAGKTDKLGIKERMEIVFQGILGSKFRFRMGMMNADLDLLLWSGLMNRPNLAAIFWQRYGHPVRSALMVSILFRKLAARSDIEPVIKNRMLLSAESFERKALGVQQVALSENMAKALDCLEAPLAVWEVGMTTLDLAVLGECEEFLVNCCREAIDRRFAGDIYPYSQKIGPVKGLKSVCFVCILSLGFLAPFFVKYTLPPKSYNLRYPSQRRKIPEGYPLDVQRNQELMKSKNLPQKTRKWIHKLETDRTAAEKMISGDSLVEIWDPTFSFWERFYLFWVSPMVLFMLDSIAQLVVVLSFTRWLGLSYENDNFAGLSDGEVSVGFSSMDTLLLIYFSVSLLIECVQVYLSPKEYFLVFWNVLDVSTAVLFIVGYTLKRHCLRQMCDSYYFWSGGGEMKNNPEYLYYSLSLFLMWSRLLRVLSVNKVLGPLVLICGKMALDVARFALIWVILTMGFAVLINGSGLQKDVRCTNSSLIEIMSDPDDEFTLASCTGSWYFFRTFLQALGEPFLDDMKTDASVVSLVWLFFFMNILLLNLLIAIMSNTYSGVSQQSDRKFLLDLYSVSQYYVRLSIVLPVPLNLLSLTLDIVLFLFHLTKGDLNKLYGRDMPLRDKLTKYLARNVNTDQSVMRKMEIGKRSKNAGFAKQEAEQANRYTTEMTSFMENAKAEYLEKSKLTRVSGEERVLELQKLVHEKTDDLDKYVENIVKLLEMRQDGAINEGG